MFEGRPQEEQQHQQQTDAEPIHREIAAAAVPDLHWEARYLDWPSLLSFLSLSVSVLTKISD